MMIKFLQKFLTCLAAVELSSLYFFNCSDRVYEEVLNLVVRLFGGVCMINEVSQTS